MSTLIGYAWVSTDGEAFDLQEDALDRAGVDLLFVDVAATADAERPQLKQVIERLDEGDTLVVWRLNRLGPSLEHLIETLDRLGRRGIGFQSIKGDINIPAGASEPAFRLVAALAQLRRDLIREQTATGRAKTPAPRRRRGRRFKLDKQKQALAVALYKDPSNSVAGVCRKFKIGRTTLYRYVAESD